MKRDGFGYNGYRGRSTATDKLQVVAVILAVLVVLAAAALLIGQRYIIYTDEGIRVELPFLQREQPDQSGPIPDDEIKVVVEPSQPARSEPEQSEPVQSKWMRGIEVSLQQLQEENLPDLSGVNTVVVELKDRWGKLGYISDLSMARQLGVNPSEQTARNLQQLCDSQLYVVGRISCFRDHALAEELTYALETYPGRRWYDFEGVRWSGPANRTVQDYLLGIMEELAALGVDEILLDNCAYPVTGQGELSYIKKGQAYPVGSLENVIGDFVSRARTLLEGSGVRLSLTCMEDAFSGSGESGHTPELYAAQPGRLWLKEGMDLQQVQSALELAGMKDIDEKLVEATDRFEPNEEKNLVITPKLP